MLYAIAKFAKKIIHFHIDYYIPFDMLSPISNTKEYTMTREQVLSRLCFICALVYNHKKDFSKSFDCFCNEGMLKGSSWEYESIIEFIKEAVKEKIEKEC